MHKSFWISLFILVAAYSGPVQAQETPVADRPAALMAEYDRIKDTASVGTKLEHLFLAEKAIDATTSAETRWAIHRELGTLLYTLGALELAFEQMRFELEAAQADSDKVSVARAVSGLGARFMVMGQLDSAEHYLTWSLRLGPPNDPYTLSGLYNNLALLQLARNEPDKADRYLDTVATLLEEGHVTPIIDIRFSLRDNRADAALLRGDSARARALVAENVDILQHNLVRDMEVQDRFRRYSVKLASLWLDAHEPRKAEAVANALRLHLPDLIVPAQRDARMDLVRLDHRLAQASGDPVWEAQAARAVLALDDSLSLADKAARQAALGAVTTFGVRRMKKELAAQAALDEVRLSAAEARTHARTIILWLVVALALAAVAAVTGFYRARVRRKQLEKQQVETELAYKRKDLQQMAQDLSRKQQWTREVLQAAGEIIRAKPMKAEVTAKVEGLKESVRSQLRVDEQREWLYREVEVVNAAFYDRLKARQPDLTDKELELCGMVRSGMSNSTIAELRHIAPTSVRVAKYRLKLKLGLREEEDLAKELGAI